MAFVFSSKGLQASTGALQTMLRLMRRCAGSLGVKWLTPKCH
jgi:hypothetical protein